MDDNISRRSNTNKEVRANMPSTTRVSWMVCTVNLTANEYRTTVCYIFYWQLACPFTNYPSLQQTSRIAQAAG